MNTERLNWASLPWLSHHSGGTVMQLCDRLLNNVATSADPMAFLSAELPEIAAEFSVQWAAVVARTPDWQTVAECGRKALQNLPVRFLEEALDRESAGFSPAEESPDWRLLAVPLQGHAHRGRLLLLAGRNLSSDQLPASLAVARVLGHCLEVVDGRAGDLRQIDRLQTTLQIASSFAGAREMQPLLEMIAEEATRLLDCDRASIFLWEQDRSEMVACPALGVEGNTLRLPDNVGIVGEVIHTGRSIRVDDAYNESRFNQKVDKESGYKTDNLLCCPLRDGEGALIGAFEGINKKQGPFTDEDEESLTALGVQAAGALLNLKEREQLVRSREQLTEQVTQGIRIIGESSAIAALRGTIERLAATDLPVLILGESGTGKEVVAQSLHYQGPRSAHPFIAINCAALTESLLESELFGHEKGAFTDAQETRQGKFELAEKGTIFLDEIGDMSLGGQAKLLRVLEQKVITRVGGSQTIPIDVRVVAATNAKLAEAVRERKFREDLYYRLSVVTLDLPSLRERPEDILPLAEHFLRQFSARAGRPNLQMSAEARSRLQLHNWPGNVRELRNLMERIAFLCPGERAEAEDLAFILSPDRESALEPSLDMGLNDATREFQRKFIRRTIKRVQGNISEAARFLGLHRSNLYRKMRQLDMDVGDEEE